MSTLRISNIEAKSVPASATTDEKIKITNSSGDTLVFLDGKTSGITTVGINTTDGNITFDANSNVVVTGIITATKFVGTIEPTDLTVSGKVSIGGSVTAATLYGNGANLTGLPAGVTINNNANNRIITGNTGTTLDAESTLTYDGNTLKFGGGSAPSNTTYYNDIVIDNSDTASGAAGGAGIKLYSGNQTWGGLIFGDSDADQVGYIKYSHIDNYMTFAASGSERLRLESAGGGSIRSLNCTGGFTVPKGSVSQRVGVVTETGMIRYNTDSNQLELYKGTEWAIITAKTPTFTLSYLVIGGGGGGGGSFRGGGGGAGAYRTNWNNENQGGGQSSASAKTVTVGNAYSVVIGAGGAGSNGQNGNNADQSKFDDITADGGSGGGKYVTAANTNTGNGSGGGGGGYSNVGTSGAAGGTYGYAGGGGSNGAQCGGGGGGAAGAGVVGGGGGTNGDGGSALASTITGSSVLRAGGGGGGAYDQGNNYPIGGGGGAGDGGYGYQVGKDATANTGSGGGGCPGASGQRGGNGGSGVVILRFNSAYSVSVTGGITYSETVVGGDRVVTVQQTSNSSQTITFT